MSSRAATALLTTAGALAAAVGTAAAQVPLPPVSAELHGCVVTMHGDGVANATVEVGLPDRAWRRIAATRTGRDGTFRLPQLPQAGPFHVRAFAADTSVAGVPRTDGALPLRLVVFDAITLRGVLRDERGAPLAGASVRALPRLRYAGAGDIDGTTAADGTFTLAGLPRGKVLVTAYAPGDGLYLAELRATADAEVVLVRQPQHRPAWAIEVAGLTAAQCAQAVVELRVTDPRWFALPPALRWPRLDAAGRCTVGPLPSGHWDAQVRLPGTHVTPRWARRDPTEAGPLRLTAESLPVAPVSCEITFQDDERRPVQGVPIVLSTDEPAASLAATTDAAGRAAFTVPASLATRATVRSADPAWIVQRVPGQRIDEQHGFAPSLPPAEYLLARACAVHGTVTGGDGRPAGGAVVQLEGLVAAADPAHFRALEQVTTSPDGTFCARVRANSGAGSTWRTRVTGPAGTATSPPFVLAAGAREHTQPPLRLTACPTVRGTVRDEHGAAAPGVRVWLRSIDPATGRATDDTVREVVSDARGRYCFAGVPAGGALLHTLVDELDTSVHACAPLQTNAGAVHDVDLTVRLR